MFINKPQYQCIINLVIFRQVYKFAIDVQTYDKCTKLWYVYKLAISVKISAW